MKQHSPNVSFFKKAPPFGIKKPSLWSDPVTLPRMMMPCTAIPSIGFNVEPCSDVEGRRQRGSWSTDYNTYLFVLALRTSRCHFISYLWSSSGEWAERRDIIVDFPIPWNPRTPTTRTSVWSSKYWKCQEWVNNTAESTIKGPRLGEEAPVVIPTMISFSLYVLFS